MMNHEQIRQVLDALNAAICYPEAGCEDKRYEESIAICEAALAEPEGEPSTILRLIDTIKYLVGIAERGEGRKARDDELPEQFVLGYVKRLEAALAEPSEPKMPPFFTQIEWLGNQARVHVFQRREDETPLNVCSQTHPASKPEPSEPVAEVSGDYNTKHIIFLPAGIALEVGDKLFTHPAPSKPSLADIRGAVARGWCTERNAYKTMDVDLAEDIADAVWEEMNG